MGLNELRVADSDADLIRRFVNALWVEEGLSENTQKAYCSDISLFAVWLSNTHQKALCEADTGEIEGYLALKYRQKASERSSARLLSSLRKFYLFALREGSVDRDPTA